MRVCRCTPQQIANYSGRLSGPLRDRLDLTVDVPALPPDVVSATGVGEPSAAVRERVATARQRQIDRYADTPLLTNAELTPSMLPGACRIDRAGQTLLAAAARKLTLTARAYDRIRKVGRTIADLAGDDRVSAEHLAEALQFREGYGG